MLSSSAYYFDAVSGMPDIERNSSKDSTGNFYTMCSGRENALLQEFLWTGLQGKTESALWGLNF